jgi:hypothetical protein
MLKMRLEFRVPSLVKLQVSASMLYKTSALALLETAVVITFFACRFPGYASWSQLIRAMLRAVRFVAVSGVAR